MADTQELPKAYGVVIGVGEYANLSWLEETRNDADSIYKLLTDPQRVNLSSKVAKLSGGTGDDAATASNILTIVNKKLIENATEGSTVFFYFSGHGFRWVNGSGKLPYLATYDTKLDDKELASTALSQLTLYNWFYELLTVNKIGNLVVILDCCHAAAMKDTDSGSGGQAKPLNFQEDIAELAVRLEREMPPDSNYFFYFSSYEGQKSQIKIGANNSVFTTHLLKALDGVNSRADRPFVTTNDVDDYLTQQMNQPGSNQRYRGKKNGDNFPLMLKPTIQPDGDVTGNKGDSNGDNVEEDTKAMDEPVKPKLDMTKQIELQQKMTSRMSSSDLDLLIFYLANSGDSELEGLDGMVGPGALQDRIRSLITTCNRMGKLPLVEATLGQHFKWVLENR